MRCRCVCCGDVIFGDGCDSDDCGCCRGSGCLVLCSAPSYIESLDALLSYLGCEEREEDEKHEAVKDCQSAAQIYMKMAVMPPPKKAKLGWVKE